MTNLGPLTTTYTPEYDYCTSVFEGINPTNGVWLQHGGPGESANSCFPSSYDPLDGHYYSPGICPQGFTYACEAGIGSGSESATVATCCPTGYSCAIPRVGGSEDPNGCTSFISSSSFFPVSVYSISDDTVVASSTTTTLFSSGAVVYGHGLIVRRADGDPEWSPGSSSSQPVSTSSSGSITSSGSNTDAAVPESTSTSPNDGSTNSGGISQGAKIGAIVGSILGFLLIVGGIAAAVIIGRRNRKKAAAAAAAAQQQGQDQYQYPPQSEMPDHQRYEMQASEHDQWKQPKYGYTSELQSAYQPPELHGSTRPAELGG